jgi:hypothetical protein
MAVGIQGRDGDLEGGAGGDAGGGIHLEADGLADLGLTGPDVNGATDDAREALAALVPVGGLLAAGTVKQEIQLWDLRSIRHHLAALGLGSALLSRAHRASRVS